MAHSYRHYSPEQCYLLPPDPTDWLPADCLAYQVHEIVGELNLELLHNAYSNDGRGAPAFAPQMMVRILFYAHYKGIHASRAIQRLCAEDVGARFLAGGDLPDHRSIHVFRTRHKNAMRDLFLQSIRLCRAAGMTPLKKVAVDGTKLDGAASKDSSITYAKIVQEEQKLLAQEEQKLLAQEEERLLAQVDADMQHGLETDAAQDALFGEDNDGYSLPDHLKSRQDRLAALRKAKTELQQRARTREQERKEKWDHTDPKERPHRKKPDPDTVVPEPDDRYNFVDPDSRMMKGRGRFVQGYNAQISVDSAHQVIVACAVTDACTDYSQLIPLCEQTAKNMAQTPEQTLADGGYFDHRNIETLEAGGFHVLIPPDNNWHRNAAVLPALTADEQKEKATRARLAHLVATQQGRADYAYRLKTVEPVFAQIKGSPGHSLFTRFLRYGLARAQEDWCFVCAAHNLGKLLRFRAKLCPLGAMG